LLLALPAFSRRAQAQDRWPGDRSRFGTILASRQIAFLSSGPLGKPLRLFLLVTAHAGTCLYLADSGGNCNTDANFFADSKLQLISFGTGVAGVAAPSVGRLQLRTRSGTLDISLTPDHGILFACPATTAGRSCAGDDLIGIDGHGSPTAVAHLF
jgi:hypothetical protein